jgi:DNA-binding NtrC family response regulator
MRVLVVDDDASLRLTLALLLRARGFEVEDAGSAEEALSRLAAVPFDAIVSDVRMGPISGCELTCRAKRERPGLKVVLMSGFCQLEEVAAAGADGFIEKPPDLDELVDLLGHAGEGRASAPAKEVDGATRRTVEPPSF